MDIEKLKAFIAETSQQTTHDFGTDFFSPMEFFGSHDDCYYGGLEDGVIKFARHLLEHYLS